MPKSKVILDFKSVPYKFVDKKQAEAFATQLGLPKTSAQSFLRTQSEVKDIIPFDATSDYTPKEEDYIRVPFRLLSATVVGGGSWKATDFSDETVLQKSMPKLVGKIAYTNHMQYVGNEVGVIESVKWTPSTVGADGQVIPGGIDGVYKINAKKNPELAMSLLASPPEIQSSSVTVDFEWEPSHTFNNPDGTANEYWFNYMVGDIGSDGKMVRRIANNILDYYESSLVWMGADPFAKILSEDGQPINVDRSSVVTALKKDNKNEDAGKIVALQNSKYYVQLDFSKEQEQINTSIIQNQNDMSLKAAMALAMNVSEDKVTEESIAAFHADANKKVTEANTELTAVKTEVTTLKKEKEDLTKEKETLVSEKTALESDITKLKPLSEFGTTVVESKKKEAVRLYKLSAKDKADDAIISVIEKSDLVTLEAMLKQYGGSCLEHFGGSCKSCGSHDVSFRSSLSEDPGSVASPVVSLTSDQIREKYDVGNVPKRKI